MGDILQRRIRSNRALPLGEQVLLALSIAAGDAGSGVEDVLRSHRLTRVRYHVLRILRGAGTEGVPASAIGKRLLVSSPDVTRLVDPLVTQRLVERVPAAEDRRVLRHRLTESGCRLVATLDGELELVHERLVETLGKNDCRTLVALCERLMKCAGEDH